jgi:hypothetical protein
MQTAPKDPQANIWCVGPALLRLFRNMNNPILAKLNAVNTAPQTSRSKVKCPLRHLCLCLAREEFIARIRVTMSITTAPPRQKTYVGLKGVLIVAGREKVL